MQVKSHCQGSFFGTNGNFTMNLHAKYESPICYGSEVMITVKVLFHSGQRSRSRSQGQKYWHQRKDLATRNTRVKHKSPISSLFKSYDKVKVFNMQVNGYGHEMKDWKARIKFSATDKQTDKQSGKKKLDAPVLLILGA